MGRACVSLNVLNRNEGFNLACSGFQVPSRWELPFSIESLCLCMCSIGTKVLTLFFFCISSSFAMGPPWLGSNIRIHSSSIGSKELLVAGCCALALLDAFYLTVDCFFFWSHLLLCV